MRTLETLCKCGHPFDEHVPLFGHPDGVEECQAEGCMCGEWRPKILLDDGDVLEAREDW
jgi:hypothetical protein